MHLLDREHRSVLLFVALVTLLRLLCAPFMGLGVDEAHYLLYALNLDLSYFDHPPLVGWVHALFTSIFGMNPFGARVSAILLGAVTSFFLYIFLYSIERDAKLAFIGVLALHGVFVFNALFFMLLPDTLLFALIFLLIWSLLRLVEDPSRKNYILLGLLLGLAGLSKYTAILFIPPILLYIIIKKRFDLLASYNALITIFLALLLITPVIVWNINHDWISLSYQSAHVVLSESISIKNFLLSLGSQLLAYNPFLMPLAFYGLYKAFVAKNDMLLLVGLFGSVLLLFFTYSSLYQRALPHWSGLFYLIFIPLAVYYLYERSLKWAKYLRYSIGFGIMLSAFIYIEAATKFIPLPDYSSLQVDMYGFDTIAKRANAQIRDTNKEAIAITHWTLAARTIFSNRHYNSQVYLLDKRSDQFDIWQSEPPKGINLVIVDLPFAHTDLVNYLQCDRISRLDSFNILENFYKKSNITLYRCTNYQGLK